VQEKTGPSLSFAAELEGKMSAIASDPDSVQPTIIESACVRVLAPFLPPCLSLAPMSLDGCPPRHRCGSCCVCRPLPSTGCMTALLQHAPRTHATLVWAPPTQPRRKRWPGKPRLLQTGLHTTTWRLRCVDTCPSPGYARGRRTSTSAFHDQCVHIRVCVCVLRVRASGRASMPACAPVLPWRLKA